MIRQTIEQDQNKRKNGKGVIDKGKVIDQGKVIDKGDVIAQAAGIWPDMKESGVEYENRVRRGWRKRKIAGW